MGRYLPLGSLNSFLSYAPQLSRAKSCFLIVSILNSLFTVRSGRCSGWQLLVLPHFLIMGVVASAGLQTMCCLLGALIHIWGFPVAQLVKNLPAMQETWVQSLGWEDPLEEGLSTHSSILAWRIIMDRGAWRATVHGVVKCQTGLSN